MKKIMSILFIFTIIFSNIIVFSQNENIALNKSVSGSISPNGNLANVTDGDELTFWDYYGLNGYFQIDLENTYKINEVIVKFRDNGNYFQIQASNDEDFSTKTVLSTVESEIKNGSYTINPTNDAGYRYLRIFKHHTGSTYLLITELEVYGEEKKPEKYLFNGDIPNLALNKTVDGTPSDSDYGGDIAKLTDNNRNSFWHHYGGFAYVQVDLEKEVNLAKISVLARESDTITYCEVYGSNDIEFTDAELLYSVSSSGIAGGFDIDMTNKTPYRYIRVAKEKGDGKRYLLISEIKAYPKNASLNFFNVAYCNIVENTNPYVSCKADNYSDIPFDFTGILNVYSNGSLVASKSKQHNISSLEDFHIQIDDYTFPKDCENIKMKFFAVNNLDEFAVFSDDGFVTVDESVSENKVYIDYNENILTAKGLFSNRGIYKVSMKVYSPDDNINPVYSDFNVFKGEAYNFNMPIYSDMPKGDYKIYITVTDEKTKYITLESSVYFANNEAVNEYIQKLLTAEKSEIESMLLYLKNDLGILDIDMQTIYPSISDKVINSFANIRNELNPQNIQELTMLYNKALALGIINSKNDNISDFTKVIELCEITMPPLYLETYKTNHLAKLYSDYSNEFTKYSDFLSEFSKTAVLTLVPNMNKETMSEIVKYYDDILGLSYDNYNEAQLNQLILGRYENIESFKTAFNNAKNTLDSQNSGNSGSTGGGGFKQNVTVTPKPVEDKKEEPEISTPKVWLDIDENHWAKEYINNVFEKEIMQGIDENNFSPDSNLTREQCAKILVLAFNLELTMEETYFSDVDNNMWYFPYVSTSVSHGILNGVSKDLMGIGESVTREDFCVMLYRIKSSKTNLNSLNFEDTKEISDYARDAVGYFNDKGVVNGNEKNYFMPKHLLTRAEAAKIISIVLMEAD